MFSLPLFSFTSLQSDTCPQYSIENHLSLYLFRQILCSFLSYSWFMLYWTLDYHCAPPAPQFKTHFHLVSMLSALKIFHTLSSLLIFFLRNSYNLSCIVNDDYKWFFTIYTILSLTGPQYTHSKLVILVPAYMIFIFIFLLLLICLINQKYSLSTHHVLDTVLEGLQWQVKQMDSCLRGAWSLMWDPF